MTVNELIEKLKEEDGEREVRIYLKRKEHDVLIFKISTMLGKEIVWIDVDA